VIVVVEVVVFEIEQVCHNLPIFCAKYVACCRLPFDSCSTPSHIETSSIKVVGLKASCGEVIDENFIGLHVMGFYAIVDC
jgi:hypothetical protein